MKNVSNIIGLNFRIAAMTKILIPFNKSYTPNTPRMIFSAFSEIYFEVVFPK